MFETAAAQPASASPTPPEAASPAPVPPSTSPPPSPSAVESPAPADRVPAPHRWQRFAGYSGAAALTCILLFFGLRLDRADLKAPLGYDLDSLLILPLVKATIERGPGGHWRNEHVGVGVTAPGRADFQELHDYPVIDLLHLVLVWGLSQFIANVVAVYNLYYLLTYPLTTLTAMMALRQLRLTLPAAATGGILYAFLPYHYQRWEYHYFLSAYWLVPLSLLPALAICRGEFPYYRREADGVWRRRLATWPSVGLLALGVAVASAGAYYAFFACAITAFAGIYGWVAFRNWRAAAGAGGLVAIIVAVGILHHLPTVVYQWQHGRNPVTDRFPEEADAYGLKIAHLLMPIPDHNLRFLANLRVRYYSPHRPSEDENAGSLGIVGSAGLVGLMVVLLFPRRRTWPYGPLAAMVLFALLLGTIGGVGSIFNLLVTSQIRAYNRISVFIAFLCLFAALWAIDQYLLSFSGRRAARRRYGAWVAICMLGFLDQVPYAWFKSEIVTTLDTHASRFRADAAFFSQIEETMPPGSKIFCLPYAPYPEHKPIEKMPIYEHSRGYIHTHSLYWSYGAMKGREADAWHREVAFEKPDQLLNRIVFGGFDGLLIDSRGFPLTKAGPPGLALISALNEQYRAVARERIARLPVIAHSDGRQFFVDLRPYRELLKLQDPVYYAQGVQREQDWVAVLWLDGFSSPESPGHYDNLRYGPIDGTVWFVNPSDRVRTFSLRMTFGADSPGPFKMRLSGLKEMEFELDKKPTDWGATPTRYGEEVAFDVEIPPGRHALRIHCTPPSHFVATDHRKLCYFILNFKRAEKP